MLQAISATLHALSPNQQILAILVLPCSCLSMLGTVHRPVSPHHPHPRSAILLFRQPFPSELSYHGSGALPYLD